ncbi:MAG: hypothetical protein M3R47_06530, partial [Chloroflexota bacterium]|nr:hypothetical protein [Chloroflexota bacterium]
MQPSNTTTSQTPAIVSPEKQQDVQVIAKPVVIDEPTPTNSQVKMLEIAEETEKGSSSIKPEM